MAKATTTSIGPDCGSDFWMLPTEVLLLKKDEMSLQAVAMKFAAFHTVASTVQPAVATSLLEWMVPCPKRLSEPNSAKMDQPDAVASLAHAVAAQLRLPKKHEAVKRNTEPALDSSDGEDELPRRCEVLNL